MYTLDNFCSGLNRLFYRCNIEQSKTDIIVRRVYDSEENSPENNKNEVLCKFDINLISSIIDVVNQKNIEGQALLDSHSFEIAVRSQDNMRFPYFRYHDEQQHTASEHGYTLCLSKASQEYIISMVSSFASVENVDSDYLISIRHRINRGFPVEELQDFCDQFSLITVKITSSLECTHAEFKRMLNSYLFNVAYNTNIVFTPLNVFESREPRRSRIRRAGQLFPYKSYNNELIKYYYQAIAASMPLTQYLAYYHVAEFFFQSISENDAFTKIETIITHPSFSPHNKESIRSFYEKVKGIMKSQKEEGVWNEETGLLLCLKRYVPDLTQLQATISDFDANALTYYRENDIPFAGEDATISQKERDRVRINFNDTPDTIYANIRNRVYMVRNAIAHSKEGSKLRYEPFKHDRDLQKEIALIRAIAEEIIINSAKNLDIKY